MSAESPTVGPTSMFGLTQKQVLGHLGYHNTDIETLAQLVSRGRLDLSRSISQIIPLEDIHDGIRLLSTATATRSGSWCSRSARRASRQCHAAAPNATLV